ncbi:hypothetical protein N7528_006332 [Penicillium herquei]|nr:hypothetical protein N7528_006332 [Penicillium herquei]
MRPDIPGDMIIRNEYLGWMAQNSPGETREIGYYGVTFDHFVPEYDVRPDVFQLNLVEIENDGVLTPTHAYGVLLTRQNTLGRRCLLCHAVVKTGDYYKMTGD